MKCLRILPKSRTRRKNYILKPPVTGSKKTISGAFGLKKGQNFQKCLHNSIRLKITFHLICHMPYIWKCLKTAIFGFFWGPFGLKKGQNFKKCLHDSNRLKITFHLICNMPYIWKCLKTAIFLVFFKKKFRKKYPKMLLLSYKTIINPKFGVVI